MTISQAAESDCGKRDYGHIKVQVKVFAEEIEIVAGEGILIFLNGTFIGNTEDSRLLGLSHF